MKRTPAVSVLMCVFNGESWLDEAIESVLAQSLEDFEFLIINDGSTDGSPDVINKHATMDSRIVVLHKANSGPADSANLGIRLAKAAWIARMDADDLCTPNRLRDQLAFVGANPDVGLLGSGWREIDGSGRPVRLWRLPERHAQLVHRLIHRSGSFFPHASAFYRKSLITALGGYRPRLRQAEDTDLWIRASEHTCIACLDRPLVSIRKHSMQISHEGAGLQQASDSMLALASYFLRQMRESDPVDPNVDDETFDRFKSFVIKRLEFHGYLAHSTSLRNFKAECGACPTVLHRCGVALKHLARELPRLPRHARSRLFAAWIANTIAREWTDDNHRVTLVKSIARGP